MNNIIRLLLIAITFVSVNCDIGTTIDPQSSSVNNQTTNSSDNITTANICDSCECTINTINCTSRELTDNFENETWPINTILLSVVDFTNNSIGHLKPFPEIKIKKLILRFNKIEIIDDNAFEKIDNLTELDLSHNHLSSHTLLPSVFAGKFNPKEWEPLPELRVLNLGYNKLHTLNTDIFAHVPEVEVLILNGNPLEVIDHNSHAALNNLFYLKELGLEYCNLQILPDYLFHVHKNLLQKLYLSGNQFTIIPKSLRETRALEYLSMDNNKFNVFDETNAFPELPSLKKLSLCSLPNLTRIGAGAFSHLTALEELDLWNCSQLQNIDENAIVKRDIHDHAWPPLKKLNISNNRLKYLPENLIGDWGQLEKLDLTGNEWSCDCENQYLVGVLLPTVGAALMGNDVDKIYCSSPPEYAGLNMWSLQHKKLRCLDLYGARPERDAAILVGALVIILLIIPILLTVFILWRRGFFFCGKEHPGKFSRAFYQRATNDDYL